MPRCRENCLRNKQNCFATRFKRSTTIHIPYKTHLHANNISVFILICTINFERLCCWWRTSSGRRQPCTGQLFYGLKHLRWWQLVSSLCSYVCDRRLGTRSCWQRCNSALILPSGKWRRCILFYICRLFYGIYFYHFYNQIKRCLYQILSLVKRWFELKSFITVNVIIFYNTFNVKSTRLYFVCFVCEINTLILPISLKTKPNLFIG